MVKKYEVEPLSYEETERLVDILVKYLTDNDDAMVSYNLRLLRKLENNKRILYNEQE